jgi:hypothetical protein
VRYTVGFLPLVQLTFKFYAALNRSPHSRLARHRYGVAEIQVTFVRHGPSLPLVIRGDEHRRTKQSDRVNRDPNAGLAVGFAEDRSGL